MFQYMTEDDQREFVDRFPEAYSFLCGRSLRGERIHLRQLVNLGVANDWQQRRLEELDEWYNSVTAILEARRA